MTTMLEQTSTDIHVDSYLAHDPRVRANRAEADLFADDSMTNEEYLQALTDYLRAHRAALLAA